MKNTLFLLPLLLIFSGCESSATSINQKNPNLRPIAVTGEYEDLFNLAKEVANHVYSLNSQFDVEMSADPSEGIITVKRKDWYQGDTKISIIFTKESDRNYIINVSSKAYGANRPIYLWSGRPEGEVLSFTVIYREAYEKYRKSLEQN